MSDKKLSRKEIKHDIREDRTAVFIERVFDGIVEHRKALMIAGAAVIGAALTVFIVIQVMAQRAETASERLAEAMEIYQPAAAPVDGVDDPDAGAERADPAAAKAAFEAVHGSSGAARDVAGLYLAELALEAGDSARARELWQDFIDRHGDHLVAQSVRLNLYSLDRQEGRGEEVLSALEKELAKADPALPRDIVLYELARTLEMLDRGEEATEYYQRILDDHATSPYAPEARQRAGESGGGAVPVATS